MNKVGEIKKLYLTATAATITRDLARAIDLLKAMSSEEERERAAVYMDGLSQMRSEWAPGRKHRKDKAKKRNKQEQRDGKQVLRQ